MTRRRSSGARPGRPAVAAPGEDSNGTIGSIDPVVTITHEKQRALLDEARSLVGDGSLIGPGPNNSQAMKHYENRLLKAGIGNAHGYRHAYAQWRYKQLTGWVCPAAGRRTADQMTPADAARDREARLEISHELGHGRLDVTHTYLGRRLAPKGGAA